MALQPDWDNPATETEYEQLDTTANENFDQYVPDDTVYTDNDPLNDVTWSSDEEIK